MPRTVDEKDKKACASVNICMTFITQKNENNIYHLVVFSLILLLYTSKALSYDILNIPMKLFYST